MANWCTLDAFADAGTFCRPPVGDCDMAESCSGVAPGCPADAPASDGTVCDDSSVCSQYDVCLDGSCAGGDFLDCDDGDACTRDSCDPAAGCFSEIGTRDGCLTGEKSLLTIRLREGNSRDRLSWRWARGQSVALQELGRPDAADDYQLCVFGGASDTLIANTRIPSGPDWVSIGARGWKYISRSGDPDGITRALLRTSDTDRSRALVSGRGTDLPIEPLEGVETPVVVQLINTATGMCVESTFEATDVTRNRPDLLRAESRSR